MNKLSLLTKQPILYVEAQPDTDYPIRILQAYRDNCDCLWADNTSGEETKIQPFIMMNETQKERARILDRAIAILSISL